MQNVKWQTGASPANELGVVTSDAELAGWAAISSWEPFAVDAGQMYWRRQVQAVAPTPAQVPHAPVAEVGVVLDGNREEVADGEE